MAKSKKGSISQRVENWDVEERTVDRTVNLLISAILLCILLTVGFVSNLLKYHYLSAILVPILVFLALDSSGLRLRVRERRSALIVADAVAIAGIVVLCLSMDHVVFSTGQILDFVVSVAGSVILMLFIVRNTYAYYLVIPSVIIVTVYISMMYGITWSFALLLAAALALTFFRCMQGHAFYFGIGRVFVNGSFSKTSKEEAKRINQEQKAKLKAEKAADKAYAREMRAADKADMKKN